MKGFWVAQKGTYRYGKDYWIGCVIVGAVVWHSISREDPLKYLAVVKLPGIRFKEGKERFKTEDEAMAAVERLVGTWFGWLQKENPSCGGS